jgi:N-acetylglucosamine-6-phosphate deacetylase
LIRPATREEVLPYFDYGIVKVVALAPEIPGNLWLVGECARRGIVAAAGHTDATYEQMAEAVAHGLSQVTHCYNAMSLLQHRFPGVLGAAMLFPEIKAELIADNVHVHPASMKLLYQAKGPEGVILITDAVRGAGMPDGEYPIDTRTIIVKNGSARLPDGSLAGSVLTLERGLMNFQAATGAPLQAVWGTSSRNAAQAIGLSHRKGQLAPGYDADLVLLDDRYSVGLTVVEGQVVYKG